MGKPIKVKLESGISIPPAYSARGGMTSTMRQMAVGQSFVLNGKQAMSTAHNCAKAAGIKVATRKVDSGVRVWRIE